MASYNAWPPQLPHHQLETALNDPLRSVRLRRKFLAKSPLYKGAKGEGEQRKQLPKELSAAVEKLPYESFDASGFYSTIKVRAMAQHLRAASAACAWS